MGRRGTQTADAEADDPTSDLIKLMETRFDNVDAKLTKVEAIEAKVNTLEVLLKSLAAENKELRAELKAKNDQLADMQKTVNNQETRINHLDQHHRSWGARVLNVPLSQEEEHDPGAVINKVYDLVLLPILKGAKNAGKLSTIPSAEQVLEVAHPLPGKPGEHRPIIMRFYNRNLKAIIFRNKKEYAPRLSRTVRADADGAMGGGAGVGDGAGAAAESGDRRGRFCFPLYEDLTRQNLAKMRAIAADSRTQSCWTVNGVIKFKLVNSEVVRKVGSILDPLDMILSG
jgi:FtsZ-binding cell division protein ZapB